VITSGKLNGLDSKAWLADIINRISDHPASRLGEWRTLSCDSAATPSQRTHLSDR
jgi:hypothetical protein